MVVIGNDAGWGGWGWALATERGPVAVGHVTLKGRTWRWTALRDYLNGTLGELAVEAQLLARPGEPPILAVERAPAVYRRGNQASVGQGLGQLSGGILLWSVGQPWLGYPWELTPGTWRSWWEIKASGREEYKRAAIMLCRMNGWASSLEPFPDVGEDHGPRGDVAEALLLAMGAARRPHEAPKGPAQSR